MTVITTPGQRNNYYLKKKDKGGKLKSCLKFMIKVGRDHENWST